MPNAPDGHRDVLDALFNPRDAEEMKNSIRYHLLSVQGRDPERSGLGDIYKALALTMRDSLVEKWITTQREYYTAKKKRVYYLSLEFLVGRSLANAMLNLDCWETAEKALQELGYEPGGDPRQGGGRGARQRRPGPACGLLHGLHGHHEDPGLRLRHPLRIRHVLPEDHQRLPGREPGQLAALRQSVGVRAAHAPLPGQLLRPGHHQARRPGPYPLANGWTPRWSWPWPDDMLVPGYRNDNVVNMRLWTAKASREFDLSYFNQGDYVGAVQTKVQSETISKVLYPSDKVHAGQELRLKQQYFFVAATFQDIFRRYTSTTQTFNDFRNQVAIQLNDTHPAIAIPELMRLLLDEHGLGWDEAWDICVRTFAYTNHTLLPEALEKWPVDLLGRVLPRHLQIIYEINQRFLDEVRTRYPRDEHKAPGSCRSSRRARRKGCAWPTWPSSAATR